MNPAQYIEQTHLKPTINDRDIEKLIEEALNYNFVGVCVPPFWVKKVKRDLLKTETKVVTVIGFPLGYNRTETKVREAEVALKDGADELDLVISMTALKTNPFWAKVEMVRLADLAHQAEKMLKVIIETAYLSEEEIKKTALLCEEAGADFVKTSTGFATANFSEKKDFYAGAKLEDVKLIRSTVSEMVGIKASGGIKTYQQVQDFVKAGAERIGTSSGVEIMQEYLKNIEKKETIL
ncbi:deoxyribose-phosphate aldolase [Bernardetia sp.]|uniref:deoxyribose-phosphate aldolase n=1 Tax=Bernardetia sp. TaxID=1937974 RepID=UPI0025BCAEB1|nr:deoxyribose-phosphate aldolase [Bernardetia sp.]